LDELLLSNEPAIRLGSFLSLFAIFAIAEALAPRRVRTVARWYRWANNLLLVVLNTIVLRLLFPAAAVGLAVYVESQAWGALPFLGVTPLMTIILSVLLLDLAIYGQHVAFHKVPLLWRLHRMHHADLDFDVTTGLRFHPGEIILSMIIKFAAIAALGAPPVAVLLFEIILASTAMFNHSNLRLGLGLDALLRLVIVTPDMHRVHHSIVREETDSNFGFNVPWWDRLFGTYRVQPAAGHEAMQIGLPIFRSESDLRVDHMLVQPFVGTARGS
jgi:sterol desaturase/sphingolipid hydroxylase (fatty acid hydroxylase superfamily)